MVGRKARIMKVTTGITITQNSTDEAEIRFKHFGEEFVMRCPKGMCMFLSAYLMLGATRISQDVIEQCERWGKEVWA